MARKKFIAGNWKMNTNKASGVALAAALAKEASKFGAVDLAVCPPFVYLSAVADALKGSPIALGAQNVYFENDGAFTGEVSCAMLKDVGCKYVILGHSERRHVIGETDELINRKMVKTLADGLLPIFCVGELLAERQSGETNDVVRRQVQIGMEGISSADAAKIVIAYEPVWAIGTGVTASPQQAQDVHAMIRGLVKDKYGAELASAMRIQYGGSVKPSNARELLGQADIDGALVGGASLKAADFIGIIQGAL
jgi:triosephosphate isomerase